MTDPSPGRPLRIAAIDPELRFGGGESQVLGLTLELARAGHHTELICDPRGELCKRARDYGVSCQPLAIRNALDFRAGLRLAAILRRGRLDVVHFHTSRAHALAPFARATASALIVTRRMDYKPNRLFARPLYNRAVDHVIAISRAVAGALIGVGVRPDRVTIIPSGVDCLRFAPPSLDERAAARTRLGLGPHDIVLGAIGALEPRKGHRHLLPAIAGLGECGAAVRCFIAGDGALRDELAAQVLALGLDRIVSLIGGIADPRALLSALDIFVFPSVKEGLGVALLEAMACGLPAVASRSGGMPDLIDDGHEGLLVEPANPAALKGGITTLIRSPEMRRTFGANARARVVAQFSMAAMASCTLGVYQKCLARRSNLRERS